MKDDKLSALKRKALERAATKMLQRDERSNKLKDIFNKKRDIYNKQKNNGTNKTN